MDLFDKEIQDRMRECFNACRGIDDPEQAIEKARAMLHELITTVELGGNVVTIDDRSLADYKEALALLQPQPEQT